MDIQLNKKTAQILTLVLVALNIIGIPTVLLIQAKINQVPLTELSVLKLILFNLSICLVHLSNVAIGIWLYFNVERLNQDKWTWLLIGLLCGQYALLLILLIVLFQKTTVSYDLFNAIQKILLMLIAAFIIEFVTGFFSKNYFKLSIIGTLSFNSVLLSKLSYDILLFPLVNMICVFGLNIYFAVKLNQVMKEYEVAKKYLWIISTLILGLFPVILFYKMLILKRERLTPDPV